MPLLTLNVIALQRPTVWPETELPQTGSRDKYSGSEHALRLTRFQNKEPELCHREAEGLSSASN